MRRPPAPIPKWSGGIPGPVPGLGHNGGPPIEEPADVFVRYAWKQAHREVWRNPPMDILRFRVARAEAAGVSYHEYMLELLDTGRHLQAGDREKS